MENNKIKIVAKDLSAYFGKTKAIDKISLSIPEKSVVAIIGPSGCGKSTFLRCINRMHETISNTKVEGEILLDDKNIYLMDAVSVRKKIGMVFQKPNPFPTMSIFDNVAAGLKLNGIRNKNLSAKLLKKFEASGALGRSKRYSFKKWNEFIWWTATKVVYRANACSKSGSDFDG